jgi:hypothetical protein
VLGYYDWGATPFYALATEPRLSYCLYVPRDYEEDGARHYPLVVVVHGTERGAQLYRDLFADFAETRGVIVLAPLFPCNLSGPGDTENYKWLEAGGIRFDLRLLDMVGEVTDRYRIAEGGMLIHGFSGGGHFAHRFLYLHADRIRAASIGAPGVVTLCDDTVEWPVGTRGMELYFGSRIDKQEVARVPVQCVVGADDTETLGDHRSPECADLASGNERDRPNAHRPLAPSRRDARGSGVERPLRSGRGCGARRTRRAAARHGLLRRHPRRKGPPMSSRDAPPRPEFPLIDIEGDAEARGTAYGRAARDRIGVGLAIYRPAFEAAGLSWDEALRRATAFLRRLEAFDAEQARELAAIARGAGVSAAEVMTINARTDILYAAPAGGDVLDDGCTGAIALPEATADGAVIHGQNWDWRDACKASVVIVRIHPDTGPATLNLMEAGTLARCGLNAHGVALTANFLRCDHDPGQGGRAIPLHSPQTPCSVRPCRSRRDDDPRVSVVLEQHHDLGRARHRR